MTNPPVQPLFDSGFLRTLDRLALLTRRPMPGQMQGERRSPRRGSSVEFADFRPYTSGDDIRQIDWNLYARMERVFLKLFIAEEELTLHLLVDNTASMNWGEPNKLDYARKLAGAFGYITLASLDRVTVMAYANGATRQLQGVRGKAGALPLFDFLQKLSVGTGGTLLDTCKRYVKMARNAGPLVICSDLLDASWAEALKTLTARQFEITVLHTLAPQEITPDLDGDFRLIDSEGGEPIEISADLSTLRRYEEQLQNWRREVEAFCNVRGMNYIFANTQLPIEEFVLTNLRQRGVLH
jgi:uncharacterized protein (DUF58 family)